MKGPEVKVWTVDELRTVCDTAHELNTKVVAHCRNSRVHPRRARAGVDLIYHASYLDDEAIEAVIEAGSAMCPTFTLLGNLADYGAQGRHRPRAARRLPRRDRGDRQAARQGARRRRHAS